MGHIMAKSHRILARLALLTSASAPSLALAQAHAMPAPSVDAVIVTALRRETRLDETPAAITALSEAQLTRARIQTLADLPRETPGLTIIGAGGLQSRIVFRGVQSAGESTAGLYLDETPIIGTAGIANDAGASLPDLDLFDVERVEALRGPQGTLYGASAMTGALRVLYNRPASAPVSAMRAELATVDGGQTAYRMQGMINAPLSQTLALRAVGGYRRIGGYIDNLHLHQDDVNGGTVQSGRVLLRYTPSDSLTLDVGAHRQDLQGYGGLWRREAGRYKTTDWSRQVHDDRLTLYDVKLAWRLDGADLLVAVSHLDRRQRQNNGEANDFFLSFRDNTARCAAIFNSGLACSSDRMTAFNTMVTAHTPTAVIGYQTTQTDTFETRLSSTGTGPLGWIVGVFASDRSGHVSNEQPWIDPATGQPLAGPVDYQRLVDDRLKQVAAFANLTWRVAPTIDVSYGARAYRFARKAGGQTVIGLNLIGAAPTAYVRYDADEDGLVHRVSAGWRPRSILTLYTEAAQGFRPGGVNQTVGLPDALVAYRSDKLTTYAVGVKTHSRDHRASLSIDCYWTDWRDMQVSGARPDGLFRFVSNAGAARIKGVEIDGSLRLTERLTLRGSGTLTNARLSADQANQSVLAPGKDGDRIALVPRKALNLSLDYLRPVGRLEAFARIDGRWTGGSQSELRPTNPLDRHLPGASRIDVAAGLSPPSGAWELSLYADNLTNRVQTTYAASILQTLGGTNVASGPPRTVGVALRLRG